MENTNTATTCPECRGVNGHRNPFCSLLDLSGAIADDEIEYCRNEGCDNGPLNDEGECPTCEAYIQEQMAYYGALFANQHHYSADEIRDCYSDVTEYHKRESLLRDLG